ncbi:hypothetical protein F5B22DRAFT_581132 [Xylaria bambusicola]|uniref:uncharacterized protein n=1 Tax=Xylaria bambusicola TaxID=326684 RepID=UPI002007602D|nr:uncharacterized protein F5B22DRAFT_581132 [Xylaria bambusicola]KAI0502904.1 hypothetical protein F5B22DRAFT_581132 [Xylaria bambusicola]
MIFSFLLLTCSDLVESRLFKGQSGSIFLSNDAGLDGSRCSAAVLAFVMWFDYCSACISHSVFSPRLVDPRNIPFSAYSSTWLEVFVQLGSHFEVVDQWNRCSKQALMKSQTQFLCLHTCALRLVIVFNKYNLR